MKRNEQQLDLTEALGMDMRGQLVGIERIIDFALAGNATLTIRSKETGTRYTYCIRAPAKRENDHRPPIWFVSVLTGSDNESSFSYFGNIRDDHAFEHGRRSRLQEDVDSVKAFRWFWNKVQFRNEKPLDQLEIWHEGRCGKCGRKLTVPESIATGFGPECARRRR